MLEWLINAIGCGRADEGDEAGEGGRASDADAPPVVRVNKRFIGPQAQRLFHTLKRHYGDRGHVLAEVALNRLLWFPDSPDRNRRARWWGRITQRSVDFVIVDAKTLQPLLAIELDDKSHLTEKRAKRDATVNTACAAAGLRLVRVPGNVTVEELRAMLDGNGRA